VLPGIIATDPQRNHVTAQNLLVDGGQYPGTC